MKANLVVDAETRVIEAKHDYEGSIISYLSWYDEDTANFGKEFLRQAREGALQCVRIDFRRYSAAKRHAWALRCPASQKHFITTTGGDDGTPAVSKVYRFVDNPKTDQPVISFRSVHSGKPGRIDASGQALRWIASQK